MYFYNWLLCSCIWGLKCNESGDLPDKKAKKVYRKDWVLRKGRVQGGGEGEEFFLYVMENHEMF